MRHTRLGALCASSTRLAVTLALSIGYVATAAAQGTRPVTFMDVQDMRSFGSETPSPDGRWMLYTISTPDWQTAKDQSDIHLVSLQDGLASSRQMTFTKEHNETSPQWSRDGRFFVFLSNRDAPSNAARQNQLYLLRPDGGEARRITDAKESRDSASPVQVLDARAACEGLRVYHSWWCSPSIALQAAGADRKSPLAAALLTVGTTTVPPILGAYFVNEGPEDLGVAMYLGSLAFAPAVGSLYAGNSGHAARHFALAGGTFVGFWVAFCGTSLPWSGGCDVDDAPREASVAIAFALGYVANWAWGLGTGISDAQRHNQRIGASLAALSKGRLALGPSVHF